MSEIKRKCGHWWRRGHEFGPWFAYQLFWQRRQCLTCGWFQERGVGRR